MDISLAKKILRRIYTLLIAGGLFLFAAIACFIASVNLTNEQYARYTGIAAATDKEERLAAYQKAIRLCPDRADGYCLLLDIYAEDGIFEKTESQQFLSVYNAHQTALREDRTSFARVCSRAGFLYMNSYADDTTQRLRMAYPFFRDAEANMMRLNSDYGAVKCYSAIGSFYVDYIWDASAVREVSQETILALMKNIRDVLDSFQKDLSPDATYNRLGFALAVCNLLTDQRDLISAMVPQEEVFGILDLIYSSLPNIEQLQKQQTKLLLNALLENETMYRDLIQRAYKRGAGK